VKITSSLFQPVCRKSTNLLPTTKGENKMISPSSAVLIVIDIQGNLFQAIHDKENLLANAPSNQGKKIFNLPIIVTEQIPKN